MTIRQHLIDPEICIRCNTCESRCPTGAISHARNYVVDAETCTFCMKCVRPCPTGAIDNWFEVELPFTLAKQHGWQRLPEPASSGEVGSQPAEALDDEAAQILEIAHRGVGAGSRAPVSAAKPRVNTFTRQNPARATVTGNARITAKDADSDVHHIIIDFGAEPFQYLEGQSIGVIPPGTDEHGRPHAMRLYSVATARDGERPNTNNMGLTVKRVMARRPDGSLVPGVGSNWMCDLEIGDELDVIGPFGSTFLLPEDPMVDVLMVCTGTGVAPFRGFTHRRRRTSPNGPGRLYLFFGARTPEELPYFGPLQRYLQTELHRELVYSRLQLSEREYVQHRLRKRADLVADLLSKSTTHLYVCGLSGLEDGVDEALTEIAVRHGLDWASLRSEMRDQGRFHVETY
ncbi:MAG: benzoyl-CoA 2,3-epoxidase subunit BoxA [Rhodobacteraceae bacterium]|nr:benzoyl-CoA 2,3-epoxidase subunit BoxA [Paracoccaceae bacterium]